MKRIYVRVDLKEHFRNRQRNPGRFAFGFIFNEKEFEINTPNRWSYMWLYDVYVPNLDVVLHNVKDYHCEPLSGEKPTL